MKNTFAFIFLLLTLWMGCFSSLRAADLTGKLSGRVVDQEGAPLAYVSVVVYQEADSVMVGGALTDEEGKFSLNLEPGNYYLDLRLLSFVREGAIIFEMEKKNLDLGDLVMAPEAVEIDAVELTSEVNQMTLNLDKRVFNVSQDLSNAGRNAQEILDNIPSVSVDVEGNVNLRGSQNVRILIDGKPSGLVAGSPDALRQLQGNLIDKVEVVTNPSARYDAEGEVGIINIMLKKDRKDGLNGSFELSGGYPTNHRAGLSLNWRKKKFNLFTNGSLGYDRRPGGGQSTQVFTQEDTSFSYIRDRKMKRGGLNYTVNFGSDFFLSESQTITLSGLYRGSVSNNNVLLTYRDFDGSNNLYQLSERIDNEIETRSVFEGNLNYQKTFAKKDQKWTIDLKATHSDDAENSDITQSSTLFDSLFQAVSNLENERTYLIASDYVHPFGKQGKMEAGVRSTLRRIINDYQVTQLDSADNWEILPAYHNNFRYIENIHAAYVIMGNKTGKLSWQAGLRSEYSQIKTELLLTNEVNPRNYLSLFPSAHLSWQQDDKQTFQLSYSRRISRPSFRDLLPFSSFSDARNFRSGNPNLNPEFTHSGEMGYLRYLKNGSLLSTVYYRYRTGVIQRVQLPDSSGNTISFPVNLATQHNYGLEFNLNYQPRPWWKVNANFNFYRSITFGTYGDQDLGADAYTWTTRLTSKATLFKWMDSQVSFNYQAPFNSPQGRTLSRWNLDIALEKDLFKGKGTLVLGVVDLFNTRVYRWIVDTPGFYGENWFRWRPRQFTLTFNYRLNQDKNTKKRGGEEAIGNEQ
ncbi:MAG: TonB-dependent receptor [Bacteroidia bacterium]|nr:TonB-dependent receptor [Bacteroidia bacterium]